MRQLLFGLALLCACTVQAQKIKEKTAGMVFHNGYMPFYWDSTAGKIWLVIDKFDQPFLYVNSLPAAIGSNDIGLDRGQLGSSRLVHFNKVGKKVLMVQPNQDYRAQTTDKNERRAVEQSFAQSVIWSFTAEIEENNQVLVDATPFFLRDAHGVADRLRNMKQGSYALNEGRSAIYKSNTRNFPLNSEFEATLTFVGGSDAGRYVQSVVPSPEAITVRMHHSFVQLPDDRYQPRLYDIRSGYFATSFFDYASDFTQPIEKIWINRHRLFPKAGAPSVNGLVEPEKPIIYYLDNGTPEPIRSALLDGARWWNQAFEAAGYKDAFRVEVLPDSADPMDIRYNIINWVHRSTRGWSYGASVIDPRTGEIIKGQVTLGSLRVRQDYLIFTGLLAPYETGKPAPETMRQAALQRLRQLSAHEVGHTLGLAHNYAASVNDRASVMDYPHPNVVLTDKGDMDFSRVYTNEIGLWDKRAVMYGYKFFSKNTEADSLAALLATNTTMGLMYISDADARAADGMHPHAHLWDNGKNPVIELTQVLRVRRKALDAFSEKVIREGTPLLKLEDALVPIYNYHRYQLEAVCKLIGGVDYSYAVRGDAQKRPTVLPNAQQKEALDAALACLNPSVLALPNAVMALVPPRAPEYYNLGEPMPKRAGMGLDALAAAEALVHFECGFLFNAARANRLTQNKALYRTIGFDDVLEAIYERTWFSSRQEGLLGAIQAQTQQMVLTYTLALSQSEQSNYLVKSICFGQLERLKRHINREIQNETKAAIRGHYIYALERIDKPRDIQLPAHKDLPPGAPIGCDIEGLGY